MEQRNLWADGSKQPASKSLIIGKRQKAVLSKQQQTFNRLVKKIEKLRQELEQTAVALNNKLDFYGKHIYPVQQQLNGLRKECTRLLYQFFKAKKLFFPLSKKEKSFLKEIIATQLSTIFSFEKEEPDDELKEIFKDVEGVSYEKASEQDFDDMKEEMQDVFRQFGFDMDLDGMHSKMTQEEMMKKMADMQEQFKQQAAAANEQKSTNRKKTKKQLEREAKEKLIEEARTKNISTIYKQLAKAFHPDLEQDEELKIQKEELMKQLTAAYENNDLHTLLRLELSWIQKEENNPDKLSDEKLAIYNQVLKEQVQELEGEIDMLIDHPRYQPLHNLAGTDHPVDLDLNQEKSRLQHTIREITGSINKLKGTEKQALAELKAVIYTVQQQREMNAMMSKFFR